ETSSQWRRILYLSRSRVHGLVAVLPRNLGDRHHRRPRLARTSGRAIHANYIGTTRIQFSPIRASPQFNFLIFTSPPRPRAEIGSWLRRWAGSGFQCGTTCAVCASMMELRERL